MLSKEFSLDFVVYLARWLEYQFLFVVGDISTGKWKHESFRKKSVYQTLWDIFYQKNWNYFGIQLYLQTEKKLGKIYFPKLLSLINHLP